MVVIKRDGGEMMIRFGNKAVEDLYKKREVWCVGAPELGKRWCDGSMGDCSEIKGRFIIPRLLKDILRNAGIF